MDEYRLVNKKFKKEKPKKKNKLIGFINLILLNSIIFVVNLILCKNNSSYKDWIYKNVYSNNISLSKIEELYNKYLGNLLPIDNDSKTLAVSEEAFTYNNLEEIEEGVKLTLNKNQSVPAFESGVVVYSGNKENYGNVIIVEQTDGKEAWYINVDITSIKIYDYIEKNQIITNVEDNTLIMYFKDNGDVVDYKNYIF